MENDELNNFFKKFEVKKDVESPKENPEKLKSKNLASTFGKHKTLVFVVSAIVAIAVMNKTRSQHQPTSMAAPLQKISALSPHVTIPKGKNIHKKLLKVVSLSPQSLTRTQRYDLVQEQDLDSLQDTFRSKKNLSPQRPLFWNDLEIIEAPTSPQRAPQIIYSSEAP